MRLLLWTRLKLESSIWHKTKISKRILIFCFCDFGRRLLFLLLHDGLFHGLQGPSLLFLPLGAILQPQVESEDCHPGAEAEGEEREEDGEQGDADQPGGEEGQAEGGGHETHEYGVGGQVRRHSRKIATRV